MTQASARRRQQQDAAHDGHDHGHDHDDAHDHAAAAMRLTIYAPSGVIVERPGLTRAVRHLRALGFDAALDPAATARHQRFAGDDATRLAAIHRVAASGVDIALAARGGYGLTRLLDALDHRLLARSVDGGMRWVGHSDLTALQLALLAHGGRPSWAGPLAQDDFTSAGTTAGVDDVTEGCFVEAMTGALEAIGFRTDDGFDGLERRGLLWGGNLTVLLSLLGTSHWPRIDGGLLFLEDVNETPYRIERGLLQLCQAGVIGAQRAVLLGAFNGYRASPLDRRYTLKTAVAQLRATTPVPVLTGLPFGHVRTKVCLPVGVQARLAVSGRDALVQWQ